MKISYKALGCIAFMLIGIYSATNAQNLYPKDPKQGILGTMYNPVGFGLYNVETLYHGLQPITATVYLPFYEQEKGNFIGIIPAPLVTPYTTALAMCAEKTLWVYANVEVGAATESLVTPEKLDKFYPFSGIVSLPIIKGPYNTLKTLNEYDPSFGHPFDPKVAQSIMDGVQRFTSFTHLFYDWNSYDKAGNTTITTVVNNIPERTGYNSLNRWIYFSTEEPQGLLVTRDIIGHEITHGILYENLNLYPIGPDENTPLSESGYGPPPMLGETESLIESFCDIMGLAAYNWWDNQFLEPKWKYGGLINDPMVWRSFIDPKSNDMPTTYEGEHYIPVGDPHYAHNNSTVMSHWFYILVNGKSGYVDDIQSPERKYIVHPLKKDKQASYKLALALNFFTCTQLMNFMTDFYVMRDKTLQTMDLVGFPPGSAQYITVNDAWHAVGVGEKWEQGKYNSECHVPFTADTWYNGQIVFHGMKATVKPDAQSLKENYLEDCAQNMKTLDYDNEEENKTFPFADVNEDDVYGLDNDTLKSRKAVSIHAFSQIAQAWFDFKFNHHGPDGLGQKPLINILGNPAYAYPTFSKDSLIYYYPYSPEAASRDEISMNYFRGINYFLKQDDNSTQDFIHPEWEALRNGMAQIFALTIKNDYKALLPIPEEPVWTLNEDIQSNGFLLGFDEVTIGKNAKLYHGTNWSDMLPAQNASLIRFWYYLLSHGTSAAQGYTNEKGHTYFINPLQKEIAIRVVWNAYKNYMQVFGTIEEFRLATFKALKDKGYAEKSKEYIALYDSWAAVMDLPDYASTLKHEPQDGAAIDPWAAKLGVEVEYPMYESSRVFEVSLNPNFKENSAPVYRFLSYAAPDMVTGMTYGRVNLEPNNTYYVRSHLYESGGNAARAGASCDDSDDPTFCQSLEGKEKWTATYSFTTTDKVVKGLKPIAGAQISAWESPLSWSGTQGADGYQMMVTDQTGKVKPQTINIDQIYDAASPEGQTKLALSANTKYTWTLAPRVRIGSNEEVKAVTIPGVSYTIYEFLNAAEKAAFPYTYGTTTEPITFKTDLPSVVLGTPADNSKLSMLDQQVNTKATTTPIGADFFTWTFFYNGDNQDPKHSENRVDANVTMPHITDLPYFEDKHVYGWTFTPKKKATAPFIPNEESGAMAIPFHFSVNAGLIPAPEPINEECRTNKFDEVLKWNAVAGAQGYRYTLTNKTSNQVVKIDSIETLTQSPSIIGSHNLAKYGWVVSAGIKNVNGKWIWGPQSAESTYLVRPDAAQNLQPSNNATATFGNNKSVKFTWDAVPNVTNYRFHLWKTGGEDISTIDVGNVTEFTASGLDFDKNLSWTIESINPADPKHLSICHNISNEATFKTPEEPKKVIPEIGFNFTIQDCNGLGICEQDIKYNVSVRDPNNNLIFNQIGILSNQCGIPPNIGTPIVYPFINEPCTLDGNLHKPLSGVYKASIVITHTESWTPKEALVVFGARVLDMWNPLHNQGNAVELDFHSQLKNISPLINTIITIKFKYDASTNNIVIQ